MPMSTTEQRELAISRFRAVVLFCFRGVVVVMVVEMRFIEMFLTLMVMHMWVRVSVGMDVGRGRLRGMRVGKRKRRRCEVRMDMQVVSTRVLVVERADLWKPEGRQEDSQQDDNTSPGSALPFFLECHAVLVFLSSAQLLLLPYEAP